MEILIVVTIIGVLAAVTIPSYTKYRLKWQIAEITREIQPLRKAILLYFQTHRGVPNSINDLIITKVPTIKHGRVIFDSGGVVIRFDQTAAPPLRGRSISFYAVHQGFNAGVPPVFKLKCSSNIQKMYLPKDCKSFYRPPSS